mmetsp:Transcript_103683/g.278595  ORF Transcript_103683/g.278595 Transcript_103683/m.278595 type:complete len:178 (-) Transcript_103683:482-1015(-)
MPSGVMKRWHDEKGFGFIGPDDGGDDVFCHVSALLDGEGSVKEGDFVKYRITFDDRRGKDRASDVELSGGGGGGRGGGGSSGGSRSRRRSPSRSRSRGRGGDSYGGGGKGRGSGGKGGDARPGDWECPGCGANVFASKDACFKCGERKRGGGRGGGGGGRDRDRDDDRRDRDDDRRR